MASLIQSLLLATSASSFASANTVPQCKANPIDGTWPSDQVHLNHFHACPSASIDIDTTAGMAPPQHHHQ
ncbi:hypothetical protein CLAFUW4_20092 [Fulvia fulva]|uniref:uncharacterized protein n=1 Tax=Passalora fulva TaxID=5499 RepID=UPI0028528CC6|nr:uncharacterized protein CLAFUR5_20092 [Fulvia fulva]KAK4615977.1 hypothetical protein CLAFUR4_20092 [Fulvia fulva]KAK4616369.1 hypothetical protein CLAFUR0_20092 [Fulvia fulva]WMI38876.1 hypothetical protein CLAFUR5_20092 [Fulvia fulva]WPV19259.1 hypothetical protein CLAFUW4_20092 [Fulvia fulva]WPV33896.1 hypothetical protein CLAFUW7_20092 [Fulvia fulva]